jgi:hypothetical protein
VFAVFCITFIGSLSFSGEEMLRVQPLAIFTSLVFFLNIKYIFATKDAWHEVPWKILIFFLSCVVLTFFTFWVSSGSERVQELGLFTGIMFTTPVTITIGILRDFNLLKERI